MKKYLLFATTALVALASCTSDDFVGENTEPTTNDPSPIVFSTGLKTVTRADHVGADAARLLSNNFVVEGIKTIDGTVSEVFDNYNVNWEENSADKTASNTANWEYVGQAILTGKTAINMQTIKYWDYAAKQYDFWAYSLGGGSATVSTMDHDADLTTAAYTFEGSASDLSKVYISDLVTAYNPTETNQPAFQDQVDLTFRALVAKIRIGLYETIPGYSVKDVKFYRSAAANARAVDYATLYASSATLPTNGTCTVSFPTIGLSNINNSDYNKAHISFNTGGSMVAWNNYGNLDYHAALHYETGTGLEYLGESASQPTWAVESGASPGDYSIILPNEDGAVLTLKVDYTLEAIDGSGEEITIHGATAIVPAQYTQWKSNYAYTYLFKISDNTNGKTNPTVDVTGLYPITFDAIVIDSEEYTQETITTVATPSITTYSVTSDVTNNNEYKTSDEIYATATTDGTLQNFNNYGATLYQVSKADVTEAEILETLTKFMWTNSEGICQGRNGIRLTPVSGGVDLTPTSIPLVDGNSIDGLYAGTVAKLTCSTEGTYAFVYKVSAEAASPVAKYEAVTVAAGGSVSGLFTSNDGTDTAASVDASNSQTLYQKYFTVDNVTYAIKVIKIVN